MASGVGAGQVPETRSRLGGAQTGGDRPGAGDHQDDPTTAAAWSAETVEVRPAQTPVIKTDMAARKALIIIALHPSGTRNPGGTSTPAVSGCPRPDVRGQDHTGDRASPMFFHCHRHSVPRQLVTPSRRTPERHTARSAAPTAPRCEVSTLERQVAAYLLLLARVRHIARLALARHLPLGHELQQSANRQTSARITASASP